MYCCCCKNSRALYFRDNIKAVDSDNFISSESHMCIKGYLYCKAFNQVFDSQKDDYCEFAVSSFDTASYLKHFDND